MPIPITVHVLEAEGIILQILRIFFQENTSELDHLLTRSCILDNPPNQLPVLLKNYQTLRDICQRVRIIGPEFSLKNIENRLSSNDKIKVADYYTAKAVGSQLRINIECLSAVKRLSSKDWMRDIKRPGLSGTLCFLLIILASNEDAWHLLPSLKPLLSDLAEDKQTTERLPGQINIPLMDTFFFFYELIENDGNNQYPMTPLKQFHLYLLNPHAALAKLSTIQCSIHFSEVLLPGLIDFIHQHFAFLMVKLLIERPQEQAQTFAEIDRLITLNYLPKWMATKSNESLNLRVFSAIHAVMMNIKNLKNHSLLFKENRFVLQQRLNYLGLRILPLITEDVMQSRNLIQLAHDLLNLSKYSELKYRNKKEQCLFFSRPLQILINPINEALRVRVINIHPQVFLHLVAHFLQFFREKTWLQLDTKDHADFLKCSAFILASADGNKFDAAFFNTVNELIQVLCQRAMLEEVLMLLESRPKATHQKDIALPMLLQFIQAIPKIENLESQQPAVLNEATSNFMKAIMGDKKNIMFALTTLLKTLEVLTTEWMDKRFPRLREPLRDFFFKRVDFFELQMHTLYFLSQHRTSNNDKEYLEFEKVLLQIAHLLGDPTLTASLKARILIRPKYMEQQNFIQEETKALGWVENPPVKPWERDVGSGVNCQQTLETFTSNDTVSLSEIQLTQLFKQFSELEHRLSGNPAHPVTIDLFFLMAVYRFYHEKNQIYPKIDLLVSECLAFLNIHIANLMNLPLQNNIKNKSLEAKPEFITFANAALQKSVSPSDTAKILFGEIFNLANWIQKQEILKDYSNNPFNLSKLQRVIFFYVINEHCLPVDDQFVKLIEFNLSAKLHPNMRHFLEYLLALKNKTTDVDDGNPFLLAYRSVTKKNRELKELKYLGIQKYWEIWNKQVLTQRYLEHQWSQETFNEAEINEELCQFIELGYFADCRIECGKLHPLSFLRYATKNLEALAVNTYITPQDFPSGAFLSIKKALRLINDISVHWFNHVSLEGLISENQWFVFLNASNYIAGTFPLPCLKNEAFLSSVVRAICTTKRGLKVLTMLTDAHLNNFLSHLFKEKLFKEASDILESWIEFKSKNEDYRHLLMLSRDLANLKSNLPLTASQVHTFCSAFGELKKDFLKNKLSEFTLEDFNSMLVEIDAPDYLLKSIDPNLVLQKEKKNCTDELDTLSASNQTLPKQANSSSQELLPRYSGLLFQQQAACQFGLVNRIPRASFPVHLLLLVQKIMDLKLDYHVTLIGTSLLGLLKVNPSKPINIKKFRLLIMGSISDSKATLSMLKSIIRKMSFVKSCDHQHNRLYASISGEIFLVLEFIQATGASFQKTLFDYLQNKTLDIEALYLPLWTMLNPFFELMAPIRTLHNLKKKEISFINPSRSSNLKRLYSTALCLAYYELKFPYPEFTRSPELAELDLTNLAKSFSYACAHEPQTLITYLKLLCSWPDLTEIFLKMDDMKIVYSLTALPSTPQLFKKALQHYPDELNAETNLRTICLVLYAALYFYYRDPEFIEHSIFVNFLNKIFTESDVSHRNWIKSCALNLKNEDKIQDVNFLKMVSCLSEQYSKLMEKNEKQANSDQVFWKTTPASDAQVTVTESKLTC